MKDLVANILDIMNKKGFRTPVRLAIMLYLFVRDKAFFSDIMTDLDITAGNLWSHLRKLEEEGFIKTRYVIADKPRVLVELTDKGHEELLKLLVMIKEFLDQVHKNRSSSK